MNNRIQSAAIASLLAVAACLWVGCSGSDDNGTGNPDQTGTTVTSPCNLFTLDIAESLGNGPYPAPRTDVAGSVSLCTYIGTNGGAVARFEKMSQSSFKSSCTVGNKPDGTPYGGADLLNETTCLYNVLSDVNRVGLSVLTPSGWAVYVNSSTQAKCQAAIDALIPKLPK